MAEPRKDLRECTQDFALRVIRLWRNLLRTEEARVIGRQLLRSGTSIGAKYRSAIRGRSRAEFTSKLAIALEEADETAYWLELIVRSKLIPADKMEAILKEANELVRILAASKLASSRE